MNTTAPPDQPPQEPERRKPAPQGPARVYFDGAWYLSFYPDVARAVQAGDWPDGWTHYEQVGEREGRNPNPLFQEQGYRAQDPAVDEAVREGVFRSAADHLAHEGYPPGRLLSPWMDPEWYVFQNPEVRTALDEGQYPHAYAYFMEEGLALGHVPSSQFESRAYLEAHPEVLPDIEAGRWSGPFEHFLRRGILNASTAGLGPRLVGGDDSDPFQRSIEAAVEVFLASGRSLRLATSRRPELSIVLVTGDQPGLLLRCLRSLTAITGPRIEVLVVENGSGPRVQAVLERVTGATLLRHEGGPDFPAAAEYGAARARSEALLFLGCDTAPDPSSLAAALATLRSDPEIGALGGRLIHPSGRLAEAGRTLDRSAVPRPLGLGDDPYALIYRHRRETAYVSSAFLLTPRRLFASLGGFSHDFATGPLSDAEYCLRLWKAGFKTVYEPAAVAWRFEAATVADGALATTLFERNRLLALAQHRSLIERISLRCREPWQGAPLLPSTRYRRLLWIDDRVPAGQLGAGFPRADRIVRLLAHAGWRVTVLPTVAQPADGESLLDLPSSVEFLPRADATGLRDVLEARRGFFDVVWVSRPHNMERLHTLREDHPDLLREVTVLYDAEALFALRELRDPSRHLDGDSAWPGLARRRIEDEVSLASSADLVTVVSRLEGAHFSRAGIPTRVVAYAPSATPTRAGWEERRGLLLVAAIHEQDSPNYDGLRWFLEEVWPKVRAQNPELTMTVAGHWHPSVPTLEAPGVVWRGSVPSLAPLLAEARIFVAPTRYGAGIPLKILDAAAAGLPVCTTCEMAKLLEWRHRREILASPAAEPARLAEHILELNRSPEPWMKLREAALERIDADYSPASLRSQVRDALGALGHEFEIPEAARETVAEDIEMVTGESVDWLAPGVMVPAPGEPNPATRVPGPAGSAAAGPTAVETSAVETSAVETSAVETSAVETTAVEPLLINAVPHDAVGDSLPAQDQELVGFPDIPPRTVEEYAHAANIGQTLPEFPYRSAMGRFFGRLAARVVYYLSGVVTGPQRALNHALMEDVRSLSVTVEQLIAAVHSRDTALRDEVRQLKERFGKLSSKPTTEAPAETTQARNLVRRVTALEADLEREIDTLHRVLEAAPLEAKCATQTEDGTSEASSPIPRAISLDDDSPPLSPRFYADLQAEFRGSRELIRRRLEEYLPPVQETLAQHSTGQLLDLGCGRGEWLELLAEHGILGLGVDASPAAVEQCRIRGQQAEQGDALAFLRRATPGSAPVITAFHLIEHVSHAHLLEFLRAAYQTLAPGGLLILETPNPRNLVTSAVDFHKDPTHQRPVPPSLASFFCRQAGFPEPELLFLSQHRDIHPIPAPGTDSGADSTLSRLVETVNRNLLSPPDYAVLVRRPG